MWRQGAVLYSALSYTSCLTALTMAPIPLQPMRGEAMPQQVLAEAM